MNPDDITTKPTDNGEEPDTDTSNRAEDTTKDEIDSDAAADTSALDAAASELTEAAATGTIDDEESNTNDSDDTEAEEDSKDSTESESEVETNPVGSSTDFTSKDSTEPTEASSDIDELEDGEEEKPIKPADPVPGSIGSTVSATPDGKIVETVKPKKISKPVIIGVVVVVIACLGAGAFFFWDTFFPADKPAPTQPTPEINPLQETIDNILRDNRDIQDISLANPVTLEDEDENISIEVLAILSGIATKNAEDAEFTTYAVYTNIVNNNEDTALPINRLSLSYDKEHSVTAAPVVSMDGYQELIDKYSLEMIGSEVAKGVTIEGWIFFQIPIMSTQDAAMKLTYTRTTDIDDEDHEGHECTEECTAALPEKFTVSAVISVVPSSVNDGREEP